MDNFDSAPRALPNILPTRINARYTANVPEA